MYTDNTLSIELSEAKEKYISIDEWYCHLDETFVHFPVPLYVYFFRLRFARNWPSLSLHSAANHKPNNVSIFRPITSLKSQRRPTQMYMKIRIISLPASSYFSSLTACIMLLKILNSFVSRQAWPFGLRKCQNQVFNFRHSKLTARRCDL